MTLSVGLRGGDQYFIDKKTYNKVKVKGSCWYLDKEEGVINVVLSKFYCQQTREGVLRGHHGGAGGGKGALLTNGEGDCKGFSSIQESIDPLTKREMQRKMMLERLQDSTARYRIQGRSWVGWDTIIDDVSTLRNQPCACVIPSNFLRCQDEILMLSSEELRGSTS